jgi:hypothetical protein
MEYATALAAELGVRPGRRRRPRGWGWVILAGTIGLAGWLGTAFGLQPLEQGSFYGPGDLPVSHASAPFEGLELTWDPTTDGAMVWSVGNTGPLPVVVIDMRVFTDAEAEHPLSLVRQTAVIVEGGQFAGYGIFEDPIDLRSHPVVIPPDEEANFAVDLRFTDCEHHGFGSISSWDTARIQYSMLGIRRWVEVTFPYVFVETPAECEAPTNRTFADADAARVGGMPGWIPDDATDIRVATGPEGTVALLSSRSPNDCTLRSEFAPAAYRPSWLPRLDELLYEDVTRCDDGWLAWSPAPGTLVVWTDFATPVSD